MRLLFTADPVLPVPPQYYGGIERIVDSLISTLRRRGHVVGLVAHPDSSSSVDYFRAWPQIEPRSPVAHLKNAVALRAAATDFGPAVIHCFSRLMYLTPLLPCRRPTVMSYQRFTGGKQITIAARLARNTLAFTGCSEFIVSMGRPYGGAWHAIPNFVATERYEFASSVPDDAPLVFLSRIERIKGAHFSIEVALRTGRRLLIAGNHAETGPDRVYWDTAIRPFIGKSGIEYLGPVDDAGKVRLLGSASAMIVPIQWDEPFGIVFVEALACGTPVISCPRGALPEIIRSGVDGFLVNDVDAACKAVDSIGQLNRRDCRQRVEGKFSAELVGTQYEALYGRLLRGQADHSAGLSHAT